jgi:hypothetical protein
MKSAVLALALMLAGAAALAAGDKKMPVDKGAKMVDSGSFGIFVAGRRIGTEKFEIEQLADGNITRSEVTVEDRDTKAQQKCELEMNAAGQLRRYSWSEISPGKAAATVLPDDQLLREHLVPAPGEKPIDQPFILPPSTVILDDYFFAQRQLLAWRYLASGCQSSGGHTECKLLPMRYPVLIPRQRMSALVSMDYAGKESVSIRGKQLQLNRFNLSAEGIDWALWLDDNNKLQRIVIAADSTEVVRD